MAKKEETDRMIGYCQFCGQGNQISETDEYLQETSDLDFIATMRCRCTGGAEFRMLTRTKDDAREKIMQNISDEGRKRILTGLVDPLVDGEFDSVTLNFGGGLVIGMGLNKSNKVRISMRRSASTIIE